MTLKIKKLSNANGIEVDFINNNQSVANVTYADTQLSTLFLDDCKKHSVSLNDEQKIIIKEVQKNIVQLTSEQLEEIEKEKEKNRILSIKAEAGRLIKSKYPIEWQLNHPRLDATYQKEYEWIDNIRAISNKAEIEGTALEDIDWGIL